MPVWRADLTVNFYFRVEFFGETFEVAESHILAWEFTQAFTHSCLLDAAFGDSVNAFAS